jgi:hypothetical protein
MVDPNTSDPAPEGTPSSSAIEPESSVPIAPELERLRIKLERFKAGLDFWKYVIVSGFVALAIAAIPPVFQLATAKLEKIKADADRNAKQEEFREGYVKSFLDQGIQQDIELRLRLADYFAAVSTDPVRSGWIDYWGLIGTKTR